MRPTTKDLSSKYKVRGKNLHKIEAIASSGSSQNYSQVQHFTRRIYRTYWKLLNHHYVLFYRKDTGQKLAKGRDNLAGFQIKAFIFPRKCPPPQNLCITVSNGILPTQQAHLSSVFRVFIPPSFHRYDWLIAHVV